MYQEVMLDLETLSTKTNAIVLSIGAVRFNLNEEDNYDTLDEDVDRCFYTVLELEDQISMGRDICPKTLKWWFDQSVLARKVFQETEIPVRQALNEFKTFCEGTTRLWGNGSSFDNVILGTLAQDVGEDLYHPFYKYADLRTLKLLSNITVLFDRGVEHNALDDAKYQVLCAQEYYRELRK